MPRHRSYTVEFKLSVIKHHKDNGNSIRKTAGEYGIDRKRVREWLNQEQELMTNSRGSAAKKRRIMSHGREIFDNEVEFGVLDYLLSERERGIPVSNSDLKEKALEIARELNDEQPDPKFEQFKGSDGWLQRWKKRNRIALLKGTNESQKIPEDYGELIKGFVTDIKNKRREHQYTLYNIGETAYLTLKFFVFRTSCCF